MFKNTWQVNKHSFIIKYKKRSKECIFKSTEIQSILFFRTPVLGNMNHKQTVEHLRFKYSWNNILCLLKEYFCYCQWKERQKNAIKIPKFYIHSWRNHVSLESVLAVCYGLWILKLEKWRFVNVNIEMWDMEKWSVSYEDLRNGGIICHSEDADFEMWDMKIDMVNRIVRALIIEHAQNIHP